MSIRKWGLVYGLPGLAVVGAVVGVIAVSSNRPKSPVVEPRVLPAVRPNSTQAMIGAAGVIEAEGRNIALGTAVSGQVASVLVKSGDAVAAGQALFSVDARELSAQLDVRKAELAAKQRASEVADAAVEEAQISLRERQAQSARVDSISDPRAISSEDVAQRRFAVDTAAAQLKRAQAQARQARAEVGQFQALLQQAQTALDRTIVRAPMEGIILQADIRPGQYAPAGELEKPLVVMGRTRSLNIRVDVDEADVPRLALGQPAQISLRGDGGRRWTARFVRVEPLMVAKTNLSGAASERIDTRVLQVLYAFEPGQADVYVGQQVDVFLRAVPSASAPGPRGATP